MNLTLVIRDRATSEIEEAYFYFERKRPGLGDEFLDRLNDVIARIQENPDIHAVVSEGIRKARLKQFPYVVGYHRDRNCVIVLGVLHGSRNPAQWLSRLD